MDPTVYVVIDGDACARASNGEIVCTNEWNAEGKPIWDAGGYADHRGAGGPEGFAFLDLAIRAAEANAVSIGAELNSINEEVMN